MVQTKYVFLQNHGWVDTKVCDYCCSKAHKDHVGQWGPGRDLQDFWFCSHYCVQCAMIHGVPEESHKALAERPPPEVEVVHPRAAWKLAQLAKRGKEKAPVVSKATKARKPVEETDVNIEPSKDRVCWADSE